VSSDNPLFTSWLDLDGEKYMFNEYQLQNWPHKHLWACHWYLEISIDKTPRHEEGHRHSMEPSFRALNSVPHPPSKISTTSSSGGRRSKGKTKTPTVAGHDASARAKKRGLPPVASDCTKRLKVLEDQMAQHDPEDELQSQSLNLSSKTITQSRGGDAGSDWGFMNSLVNWDMGGRSFYETVLKVSVSALLNNEDISEKFSHFVAKVSYLVVLSTLFN
jgi:hypothetical protein